MLSLASRPWTRLIGDDLWYLPVNALAGFGLLLVVVSRTEGSHETCDICGESASVSVDPARSLRMIGRIALCDADAKPYSAQSDFADKGGSYHRGG